MEDYLTIKLFMNEENRKNRKKRIQFRHLRDVSDPFSIDDEEFKAYYRLSKETTMYLMNFLKTKLSKEKELHATGIPFHVKLLSALFFYGHGLYQTCDISAVSQSSVSRNISQITHLIVKHLAPTMIKFPKTKASQLQTKQQFYENFGLPGIIGVIDGVHVSIRCPPNKNLQNPGYVYRNPRGYHSINVMVVCDTSLRCTFVDANFPGSVTDADIWQVSDLKAFMKSDNYGSSWILADSAYPVEPWLLTPIEIPQSAKEKNYNKMHHEARNIIRKCFNAVQNRFRCLLKQRVLHYKPEAACKIILATFALNNLCIEHLVPVSDVKLNVYMGKNINIDLELTNEENVLEAGRLTRDMYVNYNINELTDN